MPALLTGTRYASVRIIKVSFSSNCATFEFFQINLYFTSFRFLFVIFLFRTLSLSRVTPSSLIRPRRSDILSICLLEYLDRIILSDVSVLHIDIYLVAETFLVSPSSLPVIDVSQRRCSDTATTTLRGATFISYRYTSIDILRGHRTVLCSQGWTIPDNARHAKGRDSRILPHII